MKGRPRKFSRMVAYVMHTQSDYGVNELAKRFGVARSTMSVALREERERLREQQQQTGEK